MTTRIARPLVTALLFATLGAAPAPLTLDDFRASVSISDVNLDACGNSVAFVTSHADYDGDRTLTQIRVVDVRSGLLSTITRPADEATTPRWSPDGTELAFLAKPGNDGAKPGTDDPARDRNQIALISLRSVAPLFVTHEKRGVQSFGWSPHGDGFAYVTQDEAPNQKAIDAHDDSFEVRDNQWTLAAAPVSNHLWTVDVHGGHTHRVTSGAFSLRGDPLFTHDGRSVLIAWYPTAYTQHYRSERLVRVDLGSGRITPILANASASSAVLSRDGTQLGYATANPTSFSIDDAVIAKPDGSGARDVTKRLDRAVQDLKFLDDRSLIVAAHDGTRSRLYPASPLGRGIAYDFGDLNVGAFDVDCRRRIAFVASSPTTPSELYLWNGSSARKLTHFNDSLLRRAIAPSQTIEWKGAGGFNDDGVVTLPVGVAAGARAPLVLLIHGGPTASSTTSFSEIPQLMAARGWYVFQPNYRGSDNLGAAFAQATVPHITSAPGADVEDGLAAVLAKYPIDTSRIGVSGWSEGGLLTSWLITHDARWKAAMSGAAVDDWLMYADLTDSQDFTPNFISPTSPWTDETVRALYRAESPLTYASAVKTPTLIMTDAGDQRVPTPLSYAFYHAIRATGTPVTMVVIPANGHFPSDPVRVEDVIRRWVGWFGEKL